MISSGWADLLPFPPPCPGPCARWSDVRIMLPGYRDVVEQFTHIEIVGQCAPLADMPACTLGRASTKDGLPVYVLLCPQLYDRPGNPYGDKSGRDWPDNDIRFGRFASAAASLPRALWTRIGQRIWFTPMTGRPRWCRPTSPGTASRSRRS